MRGITKPNKRVIVRIIATGSIVLLTALLQWGLSASPGLLRFYIAYIFGPLQKARSFLFNGLPFSLGDILYLLLALFLLLILVRMVYFLFTIRKNAGDFKVEALRVLLLPAIVYFLFVVFWGGNYARPPLMSGMPVADTLRWDHDALVTLNCELVAKMNREQAKPLHYPELDSINVLANTLYHQVYGSRVAQLKVKPTSLGYLLNYIGIQGYYNPLSGEAQFNRFIPPFMHPFVVSHEMAHQAGIAAEDDANLLAYVLGDNSDIASFRYSAYFNIFLYAYSDLKEKDSTEAVKVYEQLNQQSKNDMDTLRAMNRRYRSKFRRFTNSMYDEYLKLHGQQEGINTYNEVSKWVYFREHSTAQKRTDLKVCP